MKFWIRKRANKICWPLSTASLKRPTTDPILLRRFRGRFNAKASHTIHMVHLCIRTSGTGGGQGGTVLWTLEVGLNPIREMKGCFKVLESGRTCPENSVVRSCLVRKFICQVRSSPNFKTCFHDLLQIWEPSTVLDVCKYSTAATDLGFSLSSLNGYFWSENGTGTLWPKLPKFPQKLKH